MKGATAKKAILRFFSGRDLICHPQKFNLGRQIVSHLPGGHFPPPKFGHFPPPNSDIYHPKKPYICQEDNCHPQFFSSFFGALFLVFSLMEDIKDEKEEVLEGVVMEHSK